MSSKKEYKYLFLSTGRTASTLLSDFFSKPGMIKLSHQRKYSRLINILGNAAVHQLISSQRTNNILANRFEEEGLPESTVDPLRSIPITLFFQSPQFYSEVKVIHIVRDPRDFVTSFMNWKKNSLKRSILHHCIPLWQPSPYFSGEMSLINRLYMSKFEHFCWIWNFKNRLFAEQFSPGSDYYLLKFEDILNKKKWENSIRGLLNFMDIEHKSNIQAEFPDKKVNKSVKTKFPKWNNWTKEQAQILHSHCGDVMNDYGYGNEDEWKKLIK